MEVRERKEVMKLWEQGSQERNERRKKSKKEEEKRARNPSYVGHPVWDHPRWALQVCKNSNFESLEYFSRKKGPNAKRFPTNQRSQKL